MSITNWVKKHSKIILILLSLFLLCTVIVAFWLITFYYENIRISPYKYQIVNNASPAIKVDWKYAFFTNLEKAKVTFDGKDISNNIKRIPRGFTYKSKEDFEEGEHIVAATLKYGGLFPKSVNLKWRFTTDTIPPELEFDDAGSTMLATSEPNMTLEGTSEPFSELEFFLNGKSIFGSQVDETGRFSVKLTNLKKKNTLVVKAKARAKNLTTIKLPLVMDKTSPMINSFTPAPDSQIYGTEVFFGFRLDEKESEIASVKLLLDGKDISLSFNEEDNTARKRTQVFVDGEHKVKLIVKDAAGNTKQKNWKFKIDTTKIVVDKSERSLYIYKNGKLARVFRVAVGQPAYPTPTGRWKIVSKSSAPGWHNPNANWSKDMPKYIPPGSSNPLGLRAIYLNASGIRIHGTSDIGSIGSPASHGCIRVANSQIVQLFPMVSIGASVDIID